MEKKTGNSRILGFEEAAAFNKAIDTDERLKNGLDRLARSIPDMTKEEYKKEMLLLFEEAGIFLEYAELEKLLLLRQQTDRIMLADKSKVLSEKPKTAADTND